jgi:hypothetical protein
MIFQDLVITSAQVAHKVRLAWANNKVLLKEIYNRILLRLWGFFDGASQGNPVYVEWEPFSVLTLCTTLS